ncbi:MAG TPA: endonuclease NucS [Fervidobacterium sp.]|nr:endonuclease NucS [Fervidobacterium sp.]HQO05873.1 endonuclease NucS [Fervidobacterium sp.]HQQ18231.1 endonuclease NucS [Fervidobacterium sp.]
MDTIPNYFLISVSNRQNLDLCLKYSLAGFTSSINGFWTFVDIKEGDYVSFLYGARVKNLYKVVKKAAYKDAERLPPWPSVTFKMSGKTYYFPYRLYLKQERVLNEAMIRPEFAYVAENLLLRGGYRKTHFQADALTFHNVSNMGSIFTGTNESLDLNAEEFVPKIVFEKSKERVPEKFYFSELILQSLIKRKLATKMGDILKQLELNCEPEEFEILGEKAIPEGYVDIFVKLKHPIAINKYILIEVKTNKAGKKDLQQLKGYLSEFENDSSVNGILIAKDFSKKNMPKGENTLLIRYSFNDLNVNGEYSYEELLERIELEIQ